MSFPPDLILCSNKSGTMEVNPKHLNEFLASVLDEEEISNKRLKCVWLDEEKLSFCPISYEGILYFPVQAILYVNQHNSKKSCFSLLTKEWGQSLDPAGSGPGMWHFGEPDMLWMFIIWITWMFIAWLNPGSRLT